MGGNAMKMQILPVIALVLSCFGHLTRALYSSSSPVTQITDSNLETQVRKAPLLLEFYAPWCGHCKQLAPEWEKAAQALSGIVHVGAIDADQFKQAAGTHKIQGFPTIKFMYWDGKVKSVDYKGGRTAKDIVEFGMEKAKNLALKRIGAKPSSGGGGSSSGSAGGSGAGGAGRASGGGGGGGGSGFYPSSTKVVNLDQSNFPAEVQSGEVPYLVEFYAPWCGHCQRLKPEFIDAAKQLDGKVKLGAVNCDEENGLCAQFGIQGFPTLKFFAPGRKHPDDYPGERTAAAMVSYCTEQWARHAPPPEVTELTGGDAFAKQCTGGDGSPGKQLCFIAFLPDILDSGAAGRKQYIAVLQKMAESFKDRPYSYLWTPGGSHAQLEAAVDVGGFGYPALVALSPSKEVYVPHKGTLTWEQTREFVGSIRTGAKAAAKLHHPLPALSTVEAWDGQDGKVTVEEEFSLDDIMNS